MIPYANVRGNSPVIGYEIEPYRIIVWFKGSKPYSYSYNRAGVRNVEEMKRLGGDQLLLQGGLHPNLDVEWYETLFKELKRRHPDVKLHALGPPEIDYIARRSGISIEQTLDRLRQAGLDSLPGAGAEILDNEIRKKISPGKCSADRWCEVMHIAHTMGFATSATMMDGHIENLRQRHT